MVSTRFQVKYGTMEIAEFIEKDADCVFRSCDVEEESAQATLPQADEIQEVASTKPLKREALKKTTQGGRTATKRATKKVKQTVKSAPVVSNESDYEVAPTKT